MPSAIQISAAKKISLAGCSYTLLGGGGVGIGNDANAHITGVGLGASGISVLDGYFTQVMGNSITAGGIRADSHHPSDPRMLNTHIAISGNIFYNNSALYSSTVPILTTYLQHSTISHNDISVTPYSGLCHGYGWGSNDAGGSIEYVNRGLYKYQPLYETPTTIKNNFIDGNLIHGYGFSHTDLGGIYTLSDSPGTNISNNYIYDSSYYGIYPDEASSMLNITYNTCFSNGGWFSPNDWNPDAGTGNMTVIDNWGKAGQSLDGFPNGTGRRNNTFIRNFVVRDVASTSVLSQRVAYRAGIPPGKRAGRPVSNQDDLADAYISLSFSDGNVRVNVTNFDDVDLTDVTFDVSAQGGELTPDEVPMSIPADSFAVATYEFSGSEQPSFDASATYTNPRTGWTRTISESS